MKVLLIGCLAIFALPAAAQTHRVQPTPKPAAADTATNGTSDGNLATAPKTLPADPGFVDEYNQAVALQQVINEIERENGLPKLRDKMNKLATTLQAWMREHKVDGWNYDAATKTFTEVKKPEKK
jgi:hypothetical protein